MRSVNLGFYFSVDFIVVLRVLCVFFTTEVTELHRGFALVLLFFLSRVKNAKAFLLRLNVLCLLSFLTTVLLAVHHGNTQLRYIHPMTETPH